MMNLSGTPDPFDRLLRSRTGGGPQTTSNTAPAPLPMNLFAATKNASQLNNRFGDLQAIAERTQEHRGQYEEMIARQVAKKQQEALLRKIKAMMPTMGGVNGSGGLGSLGGGGGTTPIPNLPGSNNGGLPGVHLPTIAPGIPDLYDNTSSLGALAGLGQQLIAPTHITQGKPKKPWYQLW